MQRIKSIILDRPYIPIAAVLCIGALLSALTFYVIRSKELQSVKINFKLDTEERINAIKREIEKRLEMIRNIHDLYRSSREVTRDEFREFVKFAGIGYSNIQTFEWIPRVPHSERLIYEKAAQRDGYQNFRIIEKEADGKIIRAGERKEYFPVYFLEPFKGNEIVMGLDLSSDPVQMKAIKKSGDTGGMVSTALISLPHVKGNYSGFRVFLPVYRKHAPIDTVAKRRENLTGFVAGLFNIGEMVEKSFTYLQEKGIDVDFIGESGHKNERFIYSHLSRLRNDERQLIDHKKEYENVLQISRTLNIGDRKWMITTRSIPEYINHATDWHAWSVSISIFLFTCLLSAYIKNNLCRTIQIKQLADNLSSEITARKQVEEAIIEVEERERRRIGHDLHDDLGQQLAGISFKSQSLENDLKEKLVPEAEKAARITSLIDTAKEQVKHLSRGLSPMVVKSDGNPILILKELVSNIKSIYKIQCVLKCDKVISVSDKTVIRQLYRIAQEAVTNAVKHAKPDNIEICLKKEDDEITMTIKDDGTGITLPVHKKGMGLEIMKYRAGVINASLDVRPDIIKGTLVTCIFSEETECEIKAYGKSEIPTGNLSYI